MNWITQNDIKQMWADGYDYQTILEAENKWKRFKDSELEELLGTKRENSFAVFMTLSPWITPYSSWLILRNISDLSTMGSILIQIGRWLSGTWKQLS